MPTTRAFKVTNFSLKKKLAFIENQNYFSMISGKRVRHV
jgi:hypothetical protein